MSLCITVNCKRIEEKASNIDELRKKMIKTNFNPELYQFKRVYFYRRKPISKFIASYRLNCRLVSIFRKYPNPVKL